MTNNDTQGVSTFDRHELTKGQQALWFLHSLEGKIKSAYNESVVYSIRGTLSIDALKKAIYELTNKHEMLRVYFIQDDQGDLFQSTRPKLNIDFSILEAVDTSSLSQIVSDEIMKPFDLMCAPLCRIRLIVRSSTEYVLIIVMHHIIVDGISWAIFVRDLNHFYNQIINVKQLLENTCSTSYFEHVLAEKKNRQEFFYPKMVLDITKSLSGYIGLHFLSNKNDIDMFSGDRVYFTLDRDLYANLKDFSKTVRVSVFHLFFACYCIFLSQYTRSQDVVIGVPFANRENDPENEIIGYFVNTLPIRVTLDPNQTILDLVNKVKSLVMSFLGKQSVALADIVASFNSDEKSLGQQHTMIQSLFSWSNQHDALKLTFEGLESRHEPSYFSKTSKFDLSLFVLEENQQKIQAYFEYRTALFDRGMVESYVNSFIALLKNIIKNPSVPCSKTYMLDEAELDRMKERFFTAKLDRAVSTSLCDLFSQTASRFEHSTGLIFNSCRYNYEIIEKRSNQWASYIRFQYEQIYGVAMPPNSLIGLCLERNEDMIFGMLGILKSGAGYMPIDPRYPSERINYMIDDSNISLLLTHRIHDALNMQISSERIICMDDDSIQNSPFFKNPTFNPLINPNNTAYVLYTSGSTGKPKGVSVSHENVICLFESLKREFDISHRDVWSLFHTYCFDISVWEIWGAFLFGGALLILPYEATRDPQYLYQLLARERVSVLTQTPSAFQMLINEDAQYSKKLDHLRYVAFVGESLKVSILRTWVEKYGCTFPKLANMYGITETTVYTNCKFINKSDIEKGRDNIGWPLEEFSMCIMDDHLRWCPVGVVGEICIGGRGLSKGYLNRNDLTCEKFIPDPYISFLGLKPNALLYKTGDLGRWLEDGSIEYLGRRDFQIKLRGFRIELGEIESVLGAYTKIAHTAVVLKGAADAEYLVAYYTEIPHVSVNTQDLMRHLKSFLPEHMVPNVLISLPYFPMTSNGKIDRKELYLRQDKVASKQMNKKPITTEMECQIGAIWADILRVSITEIDISSNFFELGGNSLLVVKMLSLVNRLTKKEISIAQFVGMPYISTIIAGNNTNLLGPRNNRMMFLEKLKQDCLLSKSIQPIKKINTRTLKPENILLTGSTGFLGIHILQELLRTTHATIYCLIRAASVEEALSRIQAKLKHYGFSIDENFNRVLPLLGNLGEEKLGLSAHDANHVTNTIDAIYHVGAWVHHVFDYSTLRATNVESMHSILELATLVKNKYVHYVSTLGVCHVDPISSLLNNDEKSNETYLNLNGYLTGKWVAEQLLTEAACRGIGVCVYRPGNIIAGANGVCEPSTNHTLLRLKGMLQIGKAYIDKHDMLEMVPVDVLASSIIHLSHKPKKISYNLHNEISISWIDYLSYVKKLGYDFEFIKSVSEWNTIIDQLGEENALYRLSFLYKKNTKMAEKTRAIAPDYIIVVPPYKEMIKKQIAALKASGFLEISDVSG